MCMLYDARIIYIFAIVLDILEYNVNVFFAKLAMTKGQIQVLVSMNITAIFAIARQRPQPPCKIPYLLESTKAFAFLNTIHSRSQIRKKVFGCWRGKERRAVIIGMLWITCKRLLGTDIFRFLRFR